MNYEETLSRIHSFQKFGSRLGLERMSLLMDLLGNPQDKMNVIHVAGTNGKGSVCRYLATVLQENGYKVGQYTSPYLERFTERIEFDEKEISPEDLVVCGEKVFEKVDQMISMGFESPTEFELVTAIGFVYFSKKPIDFLVLEVGLGGRGDSTNIIKNPLVSVITSISYDHVDVLGDTLEKIAFEKAGIIKHGRPVISNVKDQGAAAVIRDIALKRECDYYDSSDIQVTDVIKSLDGYSFNKNGLHIKLGMIGIHQVENAVCALTVIDLLKKREIINIKAENVIRAMKRARQKGRFEILKKDPLIMIDGAHNEAGVGAFRQVVSEHFPDKKVLFVVGILADKKVDHIVNQYAKMKGDIVATEPDNHRKLNADTLCKKFTESGRKCISVGDWREACNYVDQVEANYDVILFSGSLYLVGKIRERYKNGNR